MPKFALVTHQLNTMSHFWFTAYAAYILSLQKKKKKDTFFEGRKHV